jgi:hypothetical protein
MAVLVVAVVTTVVGLTLAVDVDTVFVDDPVLVAPLTDVIVCVVLIPVEVVGLATTCCS